VTSGGALPLRSSTNYAPLPCLCFLLRRRPAFAHILAIHKHATATGRHRTKRRHISYARIFLFRKTRAFCYTTGARGAATLPFYLPGCLITTSATGATARRLPLQHYRLRTPVGLGWLRYHSPKQRGFGTRQLLQEGRNDRRMNDSFAGALSPLHAGVAARRLQCSPRPNIHHRLYRRSSARDLLLPA